MATINLLYVSTDLDWYGYPYFELMDRDRFNDSYYDRYKRDLLAFWQDTIGNGYKTYRMLDIPYYVWLRLRYEEMKADIKSGELVLDKNEVAHTNKQFTYIHNWITQQNIDVRALQAELERQAIAEKRAQPKYLPPIEPDYILENLYTRLGGKKFNDMHSCHPDLEPGQKLLWLNTVDMNNWVTHFGKTDPRDGKLYLRTAAEFVLYKSKQLLIENSFDYSKLDKEKETAKGKEQTRKIYKRRGKK